MSVASTLLVDYLCNMSESESDYAGELNMFEPVFAEPVKRSKSDCSGGGPTVKPGLCRFPSPLDLSSHINKINLSFSQCGKSKFIFPSLAFQELSEPFRLRSSIQCCGAETICSGSDFQQVSDPEPAPTSA